MLLALGLWWLPQQAYSHSYLVSLLLTLLTAYVIVETNNTYVLIRTRSRMISSVWLFAMACMGMLHPFQPSLFAAFCLAVSYHLLFRTYGRVEPVVDVFHVFLMLAVGSVAFPPMLVFVPFYFWYLLVFLRSLSPRSFFAGLIGLFLPYWFWVGWIVLQGTSFQELISTADAYVLPKPTSLVSQYLGLPLSTKLTVGTLCLLSLWTGISYLNNYYEDKIQVRMMYYIYLMQTLVIAVLCLLWPIFAEAALPLLLVSCCPLLAHYFTLRNTWMGLFLFVLALLAFTAIALLTLLPEVVINFVNPALGIG